MNEIKVAFLDDGLNTNLLSGLQKVEIYTVKDGRVAVCSNGNKGSEITHGTICVKIFEQSVKVKVHIISVEILDSKKRCSADKLITALQWVHQMEIKIINLSLGTSFFQDEMILKRCVNQLAKEGHIIVAAQNNNSFVTYPAAFTNVIGVSASPQNQDILLNTEYKFDGIELFGKSEHDIEVQGNKIVTQHASSFATPYITAIVSNLYQDGQNVWEIKQKLCLLCGVGHLELRKFDWCSRAVILQSRSFRFEDRCFCFEVVQRYFFDEIKSKAEDIKDIFTQRKADTLIIAGNCEIINDWIKKEGASVPYKLMIHDDVRPVSKTVCLERTFRIFRQDFGKIFIDEQIENLDIPVVIIYYDNKKEIVKNMVKTNQEFADNGYHCKIFMDSAAGVLYGFEYCGEAFRVKEYIEFHFVDLIIILIDMDHKMQELDSDLNLRYGVSKDFKLNLLPNVEYRDIYEYIEEQL